MDPLNLPQYDLRTRTDGDEEVIYDPLRDTYVHLTPEEWVRQHFIQYLIQELGTPQGLVASESPFQFENQTWRADVVVYDRAGAPLLLVECKAPSVRIRQDAFDQGARYNLVIDAPYLVVTNGQTHYACRVDTDAGTYAFLDDLPSYDTLIDRRS